MPFKTKDQLITPEVIEVLNTYNMGLRTLSELCTLLHLFDIDVQTMSDAEFKLQCISDGIAALDAAIFSNGENIQSIPVYSVVRP